jgi:gluconate 5-dehydrogenase
VSRIPVGRVGTTDDLLGAALLFCSGASSFITGQILTIDGGLTATQ